MYELQKSEYYYITVMNENYEQPALPKGKDVKEGIIKGMYKFHTSGKRNAKHHANLFGSGTILNCVIKAQEILEKKYDVAADIFSVTSYKELYVDGNDAERWNMLNPDKKARIPYINEVLKDAKGVFIAASDYVKAMPQTIAKWIPGAYAVLGTDGYGRSDGRSELPSLIGRVAMMLPGVRPTIILASLPTASTLLTRASVLIATTEGSRRTIPLPFM